MIIVALADIHDNLESLRSISDDLSAADLVLLVGDLTNFGREEAATRVIQAVRKYNGRILAVPGNCDYPEVDAYLAGEGVNLHRRHVVVEGTRKSDDPQLVAKPHDDSTEIAEVR